MRDMLRSYRTSFRVEFLENEKFKNAEIRFNGSANESTLQKSQKTHLDENLIDFYKVTDGFNANWDYDLDQNLLGRMKILEIESVLKSWEDYLCGPSSDPRLKDFKPIDFFTEEACCGIVLDGTGDQTMYYHYLGDNEIYPLDIDFKAYFDLAIDAKMMFYWQTYLVNLITPQNLKITFPNRMKELFPEFDLEAFTVKFESLRLSKRII